MLIVEIEFYILEGKDREFREAWTVTTDYIYKHFGSLGSRLCKADANKYIAYAQWPDLETYEKNHVWNNEGLKIRSRMRGTLVSKQAKILNKLIVDIDLSKSETYP
jgi:hypothetical protein